MAHFKGKDWDYKLEKNGDDADDTFYKVERRASTVWYLNFSENFILGFKK